MTPTILLVEDNATTQDVVRRALERDGCEVLIAPDGTTALDLAEARSPDLVLQDVALPDMSGFELTPRLRGSCGPLVPILCFSGFIAKDDEARVVGAGFDGLILKPVDPSRLVRIVRAHLRSAAPARQHARAGGDRLIAPSRSHERPAVDAGLAQRCARQVSELAVLNGITRAIIKGADLEGSLDDVLAMCFDAGGVSAGALYVLERDVLRARVLGDAARWTGDELDTFFGHAELLRQLIDHGEPRLLGEPPWEAAGREVLVRSRARAALVLPLVHGRAPLGALVVMSRSRKLDDPDWLVFVGGVANQLTVALALTRSVEARAGSEAIAVEARAQLRGVFDNLPDLVAVVEPGGAIQFINRAPPRHTIEQVIGTPISSYQPPDQGARIGAALERVFATGEATSYEASMPGPDGGPRWFANHIGPVWRDGTITGAVVVRRDVTAHRHTEAQLVASERMASVGLLAAGVAHEINNPLAAVLANLELAVRDVNALADQVVLPDGLGDGLRDAREATQQIRAIVRDLKIFSRAEDDTRGPVDTRRVLESTLRMVANELRHRARVVRAYGDVPPVEASEGRLGQVFLNLIVNAIHAIPEGRSQANELRIATRLGASGEVVVEIADTGVGMTAEVQRQLFTPFFTTKAAGEGTGLGLAISHRIITDLGGRIEVTSRLDRGTVFQLHLPRARSHAVPAVAPDAPVHVAPRRGRVLVVDDEPMIARAIGRTLAPDHDVITATNARDALERIAAGESFDVILCDLMMPDINGMDVHDELVRTAPDQAERIVFMTGGAFTPRAREFLLRVQNLRLDKPFELGQLRALVNDRIH